MSDILHSNKRMRITLRKASASKERSPTQIHRQVYSIIKYNTASKTIIIMMMIIKASMFHP
jgi:hypothetical protein